MRVLDRIVIGGVVFLLVSTPWMSALGQGRPFRISGTVAFLLLFLWAMRVLASFFLSGGSEVAIPGALKQLALPLVVLFAVMAFDAVPLPPRVLKTISAPTYNLYQKCINGWPLRLDYDVTDPTPPGAVSKTEAPGEGAAVNYPMARALSIAPAFTRSTLLFGGAYFSFFLVAAFYPFSAGNAATARKLIGVMLFIGLLVATVGLLERAFWNGKVLWVFVPDSWGEPQLDMTRAIGPFANADHFADYIGMIFPLALAGALFPWPFAKPRDSSLPRLFCGLGLIVIAMAIMLSLSRAVWLAVPVATAVFWGLVSSRFAEIKKSEQSQPVGPAMRSSERESHRSGSRTIQRLASRPWLVYAISLTVFVGGILWLTGPSARNQIDDRLITTLAGDASLSDRFGFARDTLRIIEEFPLFGVGLGNWAEIYPPFQSPPAVGMYVNNAHNDYVELAAEIGLAGMVAFLWLGWRVAALLRSAAELIEPLWWPWFAAVISGFSFIAVHELFDFNLHRSANAFLLCGLAATAVRLGMARKVSRPNMSKRAVYACASFGLLGAPALAFLAAMQPSLAFGMWPAPESRRQAVDQILRYPVDVQPHLALARFDRTPTPQAIREFRIATWLQPLNPSVRDEYVQVLYEAGQDKAETEQIETSVMYSPNPGTHFYLTKQAVASLSVPESRAVEDGYRKAISRGYPGAVDGLASFYADSDRNMDAAELYLKAAGDVLESVQRESFLIAAGEAFGRTGKRKEARSAFDNASNVEPSDARPYLDLLSIVYGPNKDMVAARSTVAIGIANGVDPVVLYSGLADAAEVANRPEVASAALTQIVQYSPTLQNNERLAELYLASGRADRAVDTLRQATMIAPDSAEVYARLAAAEEAAYLYADADLDYLHAVKLAPDDAQLKTRYSEFHEKTKGVAATSSDARSQ